MKKILILQASARSEGNTHRIVQLLSEHLPADIIDLNTKHIEPIAIGVRNP